jgi:small-conductance mechanosensitive channel
MPETISQFLADLEDYLRELLVSSREATDFPQIIALIIVALISWALQPVLRRLVNAAEANIPAEPWRRNLMVVARRLQWPLTTYVLALLVTAIFGTSGLNTRLLAAADRVILVWIAYRLLVAMLELKLSADKARFWSRRILRPLFLIVGVFAGLGVLDRVLSWGIYAEYIGWNITIGSILAAIGIILLFWLLARWVRSKLAKSFLTQAGLEPGLVNTISKITAYTIVAFGVLFGLGAMGIDLSGLAVILGGLSVGIAFGLQDVVNNLISGLIILFERSVEVGNVVEVDGNVGTVIKIGVRSTTIRTRDNIELIIPNSYFLTEITTNMTHSEDLIRTHIEVGVTYSSEPRQVEEILLSVAAQHPKVLAEPPPTVQFREFGDSSLNFALLVWTDRAIEDRILTSDLRFSIWDALAANGIEIPFPQRDIHLRSGIPWSDLTRSAGGSVQRRSAQ